MKDGKICLAIGETNITNMVANKPNAREIGQLV
jgi:hypothetical protein